jgi:ubiquinone/menaquinone biosynthesis C-methylase UbiE
LIDGARQWNHNDHYHGWLLRRLPTRFERALDVGCGEGLLAARLSNRADRVDAIDVDAAVLAEAARRHASPRVAFREGDFLAMRLASDAYDVVTSVAALHHMDLERALVEMKRVLRPGGRLAILGLYRETSPIDYVASALAIAPNLIRTRVLARGDAIASTAPTRAPVSSLAQIRSVAGALLPGARVTRRLYWRYSLLWRKPG